MEIVAALPLESSRLLVMVSVAEAVLVEEEVVVVEEVVVEEVVVEEVVVGDLFFVWDFLHKP